MLCRNRKIDDIIFFSLFFLFYLFTCLLIYLFADSCIGLFLDLLCIDCFELNWCSVLYDTVLYYYVLL